MPDANTWATLFHTQICWILQLFPPSSSLPGTGLLRASRTCSACLHLRACVSYSTIWNIPAPDSTRQLLLVIQVSAQSIATLEKTSFLAVLGDGFSPTSQFSFFQSFGIFWKVLLSTLINFFLLLLLPFLDHLWPRNNVNFLSSRFPSVHSILTPWLFINHLCARLTAP